MDSGEGQYADDRAAISYNSLDRKRQFSIHLVRM